MKPFVKFSAALLFTLSVLLLTPRVVAQIVIGPGGSAVQTFNSLPAVADGWSGLSVGTVAATFTTAAALDGHVLTNASTNLITTALTANGTVPPLTASLPRWNSAGLYLQTKASGNDYLLLLARVRNGTGSNVTHVIVSYDWDQKAANPVNESIPGHRAFYSLTGLPGSWTLIPEFSTFTTNSTGQTLTATLPVGAWTNGSLLHLLWADDNGLGSTTDPQEGGYTLDNFAARAIPVTVPFLITTLADQSVAPGETVSLIVSASGAPPLVYQWQKNGADISGATNANLLLVNAQPGDSGNYSVFITNAFGSVTASNFVTVACAAPVVFTSQPSSQMLSAGAGMTLSVAVTGTQPFRYQWRRNGGPLPGATNATFSLSNAQNADSGFYSVLVMNCMGSVASSNAIVSIASAPVVLVGLTNHFWKFDQSNTDLGTTWREPIFNDAAWLSGRGLFAREDNAAIISLTNTVLSLTSGSASQTPTYYFRTRFVLTNDPATITLLASNYFDDGAIVYLNGVELQRFNMPGQNVNHTTLALAVPQEGVFVISNFSPVTLVAGTNAIAVEVHQASLSSSDIAFGMQLTAVSLSPTPLQFTAHPASASVVEGYAVTLSGTVLGNVVYFQWFKNGALLPGATASMLALSNVAPGAAGAYTLQASNHFGVVLSAAATLTVVPDQSAPVLLAADLLTPTQVQLLFSEPILLLTATNKLNYKITNTFGAQAVVQSATFTNQTNVLLTVSALAAGANYIATALNIADTGPNQNALPASSAPVARLLTLVAFDATWDYYDPFPQFGDPDPGPNWREPGYDISFWGQGAGVFHFSIDDSLGTPAPVNTLLYQAPTPAAFFRHSFSSLGVSPGELRLSLRSFVNDAVAFYLNGVELFRTNLPGGVITPATPAVASAGRTLVPSVREISAALLRASSNQFAAELHQVTEADGQKIFAAELVARAESLLVGPLRVLGGPAETTVLENRPVTFRVSSVAASGFQWQVNGGNVFGATNSAFTFPASIFFDGAQIRCVVSQPGTTNFTTNATVHVVPDTARPALLGARLNADGTMTLTFSEPLAAATAQDVLRYAVTNATGPAATITGAVLTNGTDVVLTFAGPLAGRYTVVVSGVTDLANVPNATAPGSAATVSTTIVLPMTGAWKYLLISTNETVQVSYMQVNYDDSMWLGPSNALFYVEDSALPAPKNTLLSFFDAGGVNRINTHYFRQHFVAPIIATNVTAQLSHITDDGLLVYLNGQEIYRFNLPVGPPTAATQAAANVGNATLVGPLVILNITNLVAGTNVLAAEVHQQGVSSADVVMGVELSLEIPGGVLPLPVPSADAYLALVPWGGQFALVWGEPDFALESAPAVNGPWTPVASPSPVLISATNAAAFYRLRR